MSERHQLDIACAERNFVHLLLLVLCRRWVWPLMSGTWTTTPSCSSE